MAPILLKVEGQVFSPFVNLNSIEELSKAWKICTKVKDSLEQGTRLENLSWRLWYLHDVLKVSKNKEKMEDFKTVCASKVERLKETKIDTIFKPGRKRKKMTNDRCVKKRKHIQNMEMRRDEIKMMSSQTCGRNLAVPQTQVPTLTCDSKIIGLHEVNPIISNEEELMLALFDVEKYYGKQELQESICEQPKAIENTKSTMQCTNCFTNATPLWRKTLDDNHLCNACGLYLKIHGVNRPLSLFKEFKIEENISCDNCTTKVTPLWRKLDNQTLCNACGLYYKLHNDNRPLHMRKDVIRKRQRESKVKNIISSDNTGVPAWLYPNR